MDRQIGHLKEIYRAGVERVDPFAMIKNRIRLEGSVLKIAEDSGEDSVDLSRFSRIFVHGAGKATAKMARAMEGILGDRLTGGVIAVKKGHTDSLSKIKIIEAGHPVPNDASVAAAREVAELAERGDVSTLFIGLVSGGGSACLCSPREWSDGARRRSLTLQEKQAVTELLLACGADITEVNTVRKHLSNLKGGGLARLMYPATSFNIILSDVVGDRLDSIASGLTVGDRTSFEDARAILRRYGIEERVPNAVRDLLDAGCAGMVAETPRPDDPVFERVHNVLLGTNLAALRASAERAGQLGYRVVPLSSQITGESRETAKFYLALALDVADHDLLSEKPVCIIGGGETTVTLSGKGKGGRNQEMALSFLESLASREPRPRGIYFLSAGTDGNDGPTDAAGAFACEEAIAETARQGLSIDRYLDANDSYTFFDSVGYLFKPGPTNTNVCDLQILIIV